MKPSVARIRRELAKLLVPDAEMIPLPSGTGRPRVLLFMVAYPTFSETYMHEEIRSLLDRYEVRIVTYRKSTRQRRRAWEFTRIDYEEPCLVYSPIQRINQDFGDPAQERFLERVGAIISEFRPDVMHGHYFGLGLLLKKLAERHGIPFTLRTHSMDILHEPKEKLLACSRAANSPWCERVLAFPASRQRLVDHGLDPQKIRTCYPVINFRRFHRPEPRPATGRVLCAGPAIEKKAHKDFIDLAAMMRGTSGLGFDLYARGHFLRATRAYNASQGRPAQITYADPDDMPGIYPRYDWLVYPSDREINKVGLPVGIAEAQASGLGVCWQELPGRRQEQLDYLGGAGFLFESIEELPEILSRPYPEAMRRRGFESAKRSDIEGHKSLLTEVWDALASRRRTIA